MTKARVSRGQYECKLCGPGKTYDRHGISVDHIIPIVDPLTGFTTWDSYVEKMFCEESGYQILCDFHHSAKTDGENAIRRKTRAERNAEKKQYREKKKRKDPKTNKHVGSSFDDFLKECGIVLEDYKPKHKSSKKSIKK